MLYILLLGHISLLCRNSLLNRWGSMVCPVCRSVGHNFEPCKKQLNQSKCHSGYDLGWAQGTMYWMEVEIPHAKGQFWLLREKHYLHGKQLAERAMHVSTILLQWNPSFGEMPDQVHFSCRKPCWKVTKYDVHILLLTVSVYELFERSSNIGLCQSSLSEVIGQLVIHAKWTDLHNFSVTYLPTNHQLHGAPMTWWKHWSPKQKKTKSSAVAETGDRGDNRHGPKRALPKTP